MGAYGPRDLSYREVAAIVSGVTGSPLRVEQIPDGEMRNLLEGAQLSPAQIEAMIGMAAGFREGYEPEPPRSPQTTTPTSLREWVQANFMDSKSGR